MQKFYLQSIICSLMLLLFGNSYAAYPDELAGMPAPTQWIMEHANSCLFADNLSHVSANGQCLAIQTYMNELPAPHPILLVFIHGDGVPGGSPADYLKFQATNFISDHV